MKLDFKWFIRRPFMVKAVRVTEENIDYVADWCDGAIVDVEPEGSETRRLFIRVPVEGARTVMQTEAHLGYWVVRSKNKGKFTFKVYRQVSLNREFVEVSDFSDDEETIELRTTETDEEPAKDAVEKSPPNRILENVRRLPGARIISPATVNVAKRSAAY